MTALLQQQAVRWTIVQPDNEVHRLNNQPRRTGFIAW